MKVKLAYGRQGIDVNVPDNCDVVEPVFHPGLPDEEAALLGLLRKPMGSAPLREMVKPSSRIAISVCDITRPIPNDRILPSVLAELAHLPKDQIVILIGTGSHRPNTPQELSAMLGPQVVQNFRVVNHTAFDKDTLKHMGETSTGIPIWIDRLWVEADFRIAIGLVEPHFFAGFSGGPKLVAPALLGIDSIMKLHAPDLIAHPNSTWGRIDDNPLHAAIREVASHAPIHFNLNVIVNREHEIVRAYGGELKASHKAACDDARRIVMRAVPRPYDIVITTNSGYPLDQNLYQTIKGVSAGAQIVKDGGSIICASECSDGIPSHGQYGKILSSIKSLDEYLEIIRKPGYSVMDQWQVQMQAQLQRRAKVYLRSSLPDEQVQAAHIAPIKDVESALHSQIRAHGGNATVCVLPEGPQTIPYIG